MALCPLVSLVVMVHVKKYEATRVARCENPKVHRSTETDKFPDFVSPDPFGLLAFRKLFNHRPDTLLSTCIERCKCVQKPSVKPKSLLVAQDNGLRRRGGSAGRMSALCDLAFDVDRLMSSIPFTDDK